MIDMTSNERRSYVRGNFSFKINYKIMTTEEYKDLKRFEGEIFSPFNKEQSIDIIDNKIDTDKTADASLIKYLLYMDEKLDQIIGLLSMDRTVKGLPDYGIGQNISGSGMEMIIDKPVESGQIIHAKFILSKLPLVFMDIFGEVVYVTQVDEDKQILYHLGVEFINFNVNDRERIINSVFQNEREVIRKRKSYG